MCVGGGNVSVKLASRWMSMLMAVDSTDKKRMQQTNHDQNNKNSYENPFFRQICDDSFL